MADALKPPGRWRNRTWTRRLSPGVAAAAAAVGLVLQASAQVGDPTQPPPGFRPQATGSADAPVESAPEPVRLQMIARSSRGRLAVLNGRSVHAGDELTLAGKPVQILAINDNSVEFRQDGRRQTISLIPRTGPSPLCPSNSPQSGTCRRNSPGASR